MTFNCFSDGKDHQSGNKSKSHVWYQYNCYCFGQILGWFSIVSCQTLQGVYINTPDIVIELCEWKAEAEAAPHCQLVYTAEFTLPSCLHS